MTMTIKDLNGMTDRELAEHINSFKEDVQRTIRLMADLFGDNDIRPEVAAASCSFMEEAIMEHLKSKLDAVDEELITTMEERVTKLTTSPANVVKFPTVH